MFKYNSFQRLLLLLIIGLIEAFDATPIVIKLDEDGDMKEPKVKVVCYDDLGCFSTEEPWSDFGRLAALPESPDIVGTRFLLSTRQGGRFWQQIVVGDVETLRSSYYDPSKQIKFIVHGFNAGSNEPWVKNMAGELLKAGDVNVIVVDWEKGSKKMYRKACANSRLVAAQMVQLIKFLRAQTGLVLENVHIIGHSLGAHIGGYVGTDLRGLGRITGMDPAGFFFEKMDPLVRLDETDALFVDVLHTDGNSILHQLVLEGGLGIWTPSGHVDVYINGGKKQPGCGEMGPIEAITEEGIAEGTFYLFACNHARSYEILTTTILSTCPYRSYSCPSWEEFKAGRCLHCPQGDNGKTCNGVGLKALKPSDGSFNNRMWMATGAKPPFCSYHYHVQLILSTMENKDQKGNVWFNLIGTKRQSGFIAVNDTDDDDRFMMKPGSVIDFLVMSEVDLGKEITGVEIKWRHDASWYDIVQWRFDTPTIYPQKVTTFSGEYQTGSSFCAGKIEPLQTLQSQTFLTQC